MVNDTSSKALNPNIPEFSLARIPSPRTNPSELSMSLSRSHSFSKPAPTQSHVNAKNNGFSFPYTFHGTTYYTRPPSPPSPPLPHDGWVPFHPIYYTMNNAYSAAQSHGYSHHHGNGYSNQYHTGYTIPHYNNNLHQHFYNYNCSNNFPLHTPYANGNPIYDLSVPFTNQISQVHGIRSGLIGQQNTPTRQDSLIGDSGQVGNSEWKKKKKKNKRNKRKKNAKSKGKKNDEPANSEEEANGSEGVPEEINDNRAHQNGELEAYVDGNQVHDNGDVDGQAVGDNDVDGQVNSDVSIHRDGHVDTQVKSNGKTDLSNLLDGDLCYEYGDSNDEVHDLNYGNSEPPQRH